MQLGEPGSQPPNGQGGAAADHLVKPAAISLPKGGGAIRGMGEKFGANAVTGTATLSVPIFASPGRAGFGPQLTLGYDSGAGNGPFGFGWQLALPSIARKTDKGLPRYVDAAESDIYVLAGAEDLVPVLVETAGSWQAEAARERIVDGRRYRVSRYRPRIEGLFARIERWVNVGDAADIFWRSISRDNITTWYGKSAESRIADPADARRIFAWLICESHDDKGNVIAYGYQAEDARGVPVTRANERNRIRSANRYLKRVRYGNRTPYFPDLGAAPVALPSDWLFELVFDYGDHGEVPSPLPDRDWPMRNDPFSTYRSGFEVRTYRLCRRALMFHHFPDEADVGANCLVRSTELAYAYDDGTADPRDPIHSLLVAITQAGFKRKDADRYLKRSLPPLEFEYSEALVDERVATLDPLSAEGLPHGIDGGAARWLDLDGEGIPGVLTEQGQGWFYKRNLGPAQAPGTARFSAAEPVGRRPSAGTLAGGVQFLDLAGDGQLDVVAFAAPQPGYFERSEAHGWERFNPFASLPRIDWRSPSLRLIDLTGDGHADVLITEDDGLCWHPSLAESGFGPAEKLRQALEEESGPRLTFADSAQSIYLADMSGDGLTDLVRIRNGEICYWPNLGYGRFGAKVTMDNAPWFDAPDRFTHDRLRLADIDGSGLTDVIYLAPEGPRLYFNQSGNAWADARTLTGFPAISNAASIQVVDLLGVGTACLVWWSPLAGDGRAALRYVDLMAGQKPHLLLKTANNFGAETIVGYAPSTKFYLADQAAGKPWITRLPFPVHVVERIETIDRISGNRFVSRYAYHHGHFDGAEREFRGFGLVEQWDTEEFAALSADGALPNGTNFDASSHVPPVLTRTWFHTGVYLGRAQVSNHFAGLLDSQDVGEYYREPGLSDEAARALLLEDTVLPDGLTAEEERQACRALKGVMLRKEVYGLDGSSKAVHPYAVTEQNFTVELVQPQAGNRHAVFFTHARETLNYQYERNPADPRVSHSLTFEVDAFGNPLRLAAVAYGRRLPDPASLPEDQAEQARVHIVYTEHGLTNAVERDDQYRAPLPCETRNYELTGIAPADGRRFALAELLEAASDAASLAYHLSPTLGITQKRVIEHARTLYRPDDLGAALGDALALLPLGRLESRALQGERYKLAYAAEMVAQRFAGRVTPDMMAEEARYVHLDGDAHWWIPAGRTFYSPLADADPATEMDAALAHFFTSRRVRDPMHRPGFATESLISFDDYDLLVVETRDALGNAMQADNDYRLLQSRVQTDANGNRTAVAFDALGVVVGTAVMGKADEDLGDTLEGFEADPSEEDVAGHLASPLADPHTILQGATTRMLYDVYAYLRTRSDPQPAPTGVYTLMRETHLSDLEPGAQTRLQHGFIYFDGFGREIQQKIQAEPGPVGTDPVPLGSRWVGSGWTVFDNKGNPVRRFEPFFCATHAFEFDVRAGVSPIVCYDALQREVTTLYPNHSWQKAVFGAWHQQTWDVNDTVAIENPASDPDVGAWLARLDPAAYLPTWQQARREGALGPDEQDAAGKAVLHADTPTLAHLDALGRAFLTVSHNRTSEEGAPAVEALLATHVQRDIQGQSVAVIDARGCVVRHYEYDMLGNVVRTLGVDDGERFVLPGALGKAIRSWDARGHAFRTEYDVLHRVRGQYVQGTDAVHSDPRVLAGEVQFQKIEYGEGQAEDRARNLRTRAFRSYDGAGVLESSAYDYKGNVLRAHRQLALDYKGVLDWTGEVVLETESFSSVLRYDALNRNVAAIRPDGSELQFAYNEANLLEQVTVRLPGAAQSTPVVAGLDYDARGQRTRIVYGNGVITRYEYDPLTFRLLRLGTSRNRDGDLQDLRYSFDPAGNLVRIRDLAQQTVYFANAAVAADADFRYDALYQLLEASGREHAGLDAQPDASDPPAQPLPNAADGEALRRYVQTYRYDAAGNLERMAHRASGGGWTRDYRYAVDSNRLLSTSRPGDDPNEAFSSAYAYDAHGAMTSMPHLSTLAWDFAQQLRASSSQVVNSGSPETTYYVYDAAGQRVRKVTERQSASGVTPTRLREHCYVTGFESFREYDGSGEAVRLRRDTLHVAGDTQRHALIETLVVRDGVTASQPSSLTRYQLGNHLGSACLELDAAAQLLSYEEYHPFGSTSYRAVSAVEASVKRYRYGGKEKDEETALYYHGARYYAAWLGRWCSADPGGIRDGPNLYCFVRNNPVVAVDPSGKSSLIFMLALQSDNGTVDLNDLNSEPLLTADNVSAFWNGGGNNLVVGAIIFTGGAIVILGTGGAATPFVLVSSGMAVGGGLFGVMAGTTELSGRAYGAFGENGLVLNEEQTAEFNRLANLTMSVTSSPGGMAGGALGLAYGRDIESAETGAAIGGVVEFGVTGVQSVRRFMSGGSGATGTLWKTSFDKRITPTGPVAVEGTSVLLTHGSPGRVEVLGASMPVGAVAPLVTASGSKRFLVASCSVACDAGALRGLANRTGTEIGGFINPVSFSDGTDFLTGNKWAWQIVETSADEWGVISEVTKLLPEPNGAQSVPVWFLPDKEAAQFFEMLRIGGQGMQQTERVKDLATP